MNKNFAVTGVGGFVAPRHLQAIRDTHNRIVAAVDPKDAVGVLDRFAFDVRFFTTRAVVCVGSSASSCSLDIFISLEIVVLTLSDVTWTVFLFLCPSAALLPFLNWVDTLITGFGFPPRSPLRLAIDTLGKIKHP